MSKRVLQQTNAVCLIIHVLVKSENMLIWKKSNLKQKEWTCISSRSPNALDGQILLTLCCSLPSMLNIVLKLININCCFIRFRHHFKICNCWFCLETPAHLRSWQAESRAPASRRGSGARGGGGSRCCTQRVGSWDKLRIPNCQPVLDPTPLISWKI